MVIILASLQHAFLYQFV